MYGWVLDCFQLFVEDNEPGTWAKIRDYPYESNDSKEDEEEDLPELGGFIRHKYYPDELSVRLFVSVSAIWHEEFDVVLEQYGEFFIEFYEKSSFAPMLRSVASSLQGFLNSINRIHLNLQIALPELLPPDLLTLVDDNIPDSLLLLYRSKRMGLGPLTKGVVKASAREFVGVEVDICQVNKIPGYVDTNCPSIFEEESSESIFSTVQLFRITAKDPEKTHLLFDREQGTNQETMPMMDEVATCPFSGKRVKMTANNTDSQEPTTQVEQAAADQTKGADINIKNDKDHTLFLTPDRQISFSDFDRIFHFYILVSNNNDKLEIAHVGKGISKNNNNNDIAAAQGMKKFSFQFISPPLQHSYSALSQNADSPMIISCSTGSYTSVQYLFKAVELSSGLMLLHGAPLVRTLRQIEDAGLALTTLPPETKDLVCLTEHFAAEVNSSKKLDHANKALVDQTKRKLTTELDLKMKHHRIFRFGVVLFFFALDVVDIITNWLGYEEIRSDDKLEHLVLPYFIFLILISMITVFVLGSESLELVQIIKELYTGKAEVESLKLKQEGVGGDKSFEACVHELEVLGGKIKSGTFNIVTGLFDDVSMAVLSVLALDAQKNTIEFSTGSSLFTSMVVSFIVLGFKLRSIETVMTALREYHIVNKEKEEAQLQRLNTITTEQGNGGRGTTMEEDDRLENVVSIVDFVIRSV